MNKIDCSVIILSYNTSRITDVCLDKLVRAKLVASKQDIKVEIIVVDNCSSDGSAEMISKKYPQIKLIASKTNTGFTGGNNLGMSKSSGKYILLLNSDAFVESDTLIKCIRYLEKNSQCDVLGCRLLNKDRSLQPSAGYLPGPLNTILWLLGMDFIFSIHPKRKTFFSKAKPVGWVMGAFMFMRKKVYQKTGGFDEKLFMYMEEVEWCKRMSDMGFGVWYVPDFSVVHLGQASSSKDPKIPLVKEIQALPYFFSKHYFNWKWIINGVIRIGMLLRWLVFGLLKKTEKSRIYKEILFDI